MRRALKRGWPFIHGAEKPKPASRRHIHIGLAFAGVGIGVLAVSWISDFALGVAFAPLAVFVGGSLVLLGLPSGPKERNPHHDAMMAWRRSESERKRSTDERH